MHELIRYLTEMREGGIINNYALGGATALIYYFEPIQTQDVDVFVVLSVEPNSVVNLAPIYAFLSSRECEARGEYVIVGGIPVQFLVPYNPLVEEAVREALNAPFGTDVCRVPSLEHLMAIMVQTGRAKDKARLEELGKFPELFDRARFHSILSRFNLGASWQKITAQITFP